MDGRRYKTEQVRIFCLEMCIRDSYMARVAFVMDKLLRKIGLSGRSFVPMVIGFGCSVPAIMASRTLSSERDRKMTILLTPFMSCSAKLPIYSVFTAAFFPEHGALVMMALYVTGMVLSLIHILHRRPGHAPVPQRAHHLQDPGGTVQRQERPGL